MLNFLFLYGLNLVGDFVFQNDFIAKFKATNNYILFVHSALWTFAVSLGLYYIGLLSLWKIAFLLVGHMVIDKWKCNHKRKDLALTKLLWIDQALHVEQLLVVYYF